MLLVKLDIKADSANFHGFNFIKNNKPAIIGSYSHYVGLTDPATTAGFYYEARDLDKYLFVFEADKNLNLNYDFIITNNTTIARADTTIFMDRCYNVYYSNQYLCFMEALAAREASIINSLESRFTKPQINSLKKMKFSHLLDILKMINEAESAKAKLAERDQELIALRKQILMIRSQFNMIQLS